MYGFAECLSKCSCVKGVVPMASLWGGNGTPGQGCSNSTVVLINYFSVAVTNSMAKGTSRQRSLGLQSPREASQQGGMGQAARDGSWKITPSPQMQSREKLDAWQGFKPVVLSVWFMTPLGVEPFGRNPFTGSPKTIESQIHLHYDG